MSGPPRDTTPLNTMLLAITACLLWSTAFVGVKIGLLYSPPLSFAAVRFMLSGLLLTPFWLTRPGIFRSILENWKTICLLALFQTFLLYGLFYIGMTMIGGALAAIIIGASPLTSALTAHYCLSNEPMTRAKSLSLGVGMLGIIIISLSRLPWISPQGFNELIGILLLLLSTVFSAYGNVLIVKNPGGLDAIPLNSLQIFTGGLFLFILSLPLEGLPVLERPWQFYTALSWLSFLSATAFSLWFYLLKRRGVTVSRLNLWKFLIPVAGAIFSWLFLPGESPGLYPVLGMLCVASAIVLYYLTE